jgi:hypothetical protein
LLKLQFTIPDIEQLAILELVPKEELDTEFPELPVNLMPLSAVTLAILVALAPPYKFKA